MKVKKYCPSYSLNEENLDNIQSHKFKKKPVREPRMSK